MLSLNYPNIVDDNGHLHSIIDPTLYLTFGPWIYQVPQYKPESLLMLGYGGGTVAKLARMFYGDIPITGVDIADCSEFLIDVEFIQADAKEWIKTAPKYDCITVDLFTVSDHPEDFVLTKDFADAVCERANYVILYVGKQDDISNWPKPMRWLSTRDGTPNEPRFYYFSLKYIPRLPVG